jgi:hypothetical protein
MGVHIRLRQAVGFVVAVLLFLIGSGGPTQTIDAARKTLNFLNVDAPHWLTAERVEPWARPGIFILALVLIIWAFWPLIIRAWRWIIKSSPLSRSRAFNPTSHDYIPVEEAGRWLYANASDGLKTALKRMVPDPFPTIAEHGAAYFKTQWQEGRCSLYGRWEAGLPMERIDAKDGDFAVFSAAFGSDRRPILDPSVIRADLQVVLDYYEATVPKRSPGLADPIRSQRDTPLAEALMFIATGRWGEDPWENGGGQLQALSDALQRFRQQASDGDLTVWGKRDSHGVWTRIHATYWINHTVDLMDVLKGETRTKAYNQMGNEPLYIDLMVCRSEVQRARSAVPS